MGQFSKVIFFVTGLIVCLVVSVGADNKSKPTKSEPVPVKMDNVVPSEEATPTTFQIPWTSVNAGGELNLGSTNYKMKVSTGQSVIGQSQSTNYQMGIGFWYGAIPCVAAVVGDLALPLNGNRTPADVVTIINLVFKSRPLDPSVNPCAADVNKSGGVPSPADVVTLINNVFKNRPLPFGESCGC